ncbi:MAG: hypothetical protein Unbinned1520contig1002_13 [Prokaryotic dsDNA virus sp.]|nr:MAG: hypothetical protein Unbinned1520contig1002_13 [Prokaryotic dsDNA virus sp.]|tara:strand:+ start:29647 stop:32142 length:2496 start_codon:yes stop_codon:yes gene_type:complete
MTSRFIAPFYNVGSGIKPSSGAKLFFYAVDGVTPKDTYSDQLSTPTPNANPVIADSTGTFSDIYISGEYKVTLQDKNGSQIFGGAEVAEGMSTSNLEEILINDLSQAYTFQTVAEMTGVFPVGKSLHVSGGDNLFTCYIVVDTPSDVSLGGGLWAKELDFDVEQETSKILINDLSQAYEFDTLDDAVNCTINFPVGKVINLKERTTGSGGGAIWDVALTSSVTTNTFNIMQSAGVPTLALVLRVGENINVSNWVDTDADFQAAIPFMDVLGKKIVIDRATSASTATTIISDVEFTPVGTYTTAQVAPDPNVARYTFNGNVTAHRTEIFPGDGDIELKGSIRVAYPEWFGIFNEVNGNDGSVDLDQNIRRAGRCNGDSQCDIEFGDGLYYIRDFLIDQSNSGILGQGKDRTFLKNSIVNNVSTRFGVQITAYAPSTGVGNNLGNRDWLGVNAPISDIKLEGFTVIWNDDDTVATDPQMNGVAILGVMGCVVKDVHVTMPTGQRAFAVQTNDEDQKTEDILVTECSSDGAISGIYVSEGFVSNIGKTFKNIQVINNHFTVRLVATNEPLGPSSPIIIHGVEVPANINAGKVIIRGNHLEGGAKGIHTQSPDIGMKFNSQVTVENNSLEDFREHGILSYLENMEIIRNEFDSTLVKTNTIQAGGIILYTNPEGGALKNTIKGNTFKNLSGTGTIYGIQIIKNEGCSHLIDGNYFAFEDGIAPAYQVFFLDSTGVLGDVKLSNNKFFDTGAANVRGTTVNMEMLVWDLGGNQGMNLFNGEIHGVRFGTPTDSRYYKRGTYLNYGIATFSTNTQVGFICTADHKPTAAGTWKNVIG